MPSIFGHGLVGIASANASKELLKDISFKKLLILSFLAANLPDFDVVFHHLGLSHIEFLKHRNFFHSIFFAFFATSAFAFFCLRNLSKLRKLFFWSYFFLLIMSHNLLDALTKNIGVALFYPILKEQISLPITPLLPAGFTFAEYQKAFWVEFQYIWAPCILISLSSIVISRKMSK